MFTFLFFLFRISSAVSLYFKRYDTSLDEGNAFLLTHCRYNLASWLGELLIGFACLLEKRFACLLEKPVDEK